MDQPSRPDDVTQQGAPSAPPAPEPVGSTAGPGDAPPPAPEPAYPPPVPAPAYPSPAAPSQGSWNVLAEPLGPAPGLRFAPHGGRLVAYVVDVILLSIIATLVVVGFVVLGGVLGAAGAVPLAVLVVTFGIAAGSLVGIGYFPWFWARGGQTPGMRIFDLRLVRDADGGPVGWGAAILRLVGFWISGVVFYIGFAWILVDKRRRGWPDLIAGTIMVQPG